MLTRTLAQLRDAIQRTADVVAFTDKHPVPYINDLANRGLGALSRLCRTTNPQFQPIASAVITTDGKAFSYPLPTNFRSLISVEYTHDNRKVWLESHAMSERARLTSPEVAAGSLCANGFFVNGTDIELLPLPAKGDTALLWYATDVQQLLLDESKVAVMDRLDDYVIWWAAREIAQEREAWERVDRLTQRLAELEGDIRILARSIDLTGPSKVVDDRIANPFDRYGRRYSRARMR